MWVTERTQQHAAVEQRRRVCGELPRSRTGSGQGTDCTQRGEERKGEETGFLFLLLLPKKLDTFSVEGWIWPWTSYVRWVEGAARNSDFLFVCVSKSHVSCSRTVRRSSRLCQKGSSCFFPRVFFSIDWALFFFFLQVVNNSCKCSLNACFIALYVTAGVNYTAQWGCRDCVCARLSPHDWSVTDWPVWVI